jgi:hypothetical protein
VNFSLTIMSYLGRFSLKVSSKTMLVPFLLIVGFAILSA